MVADPHRLEPTPSEPSLPSLPKGVFALPLCSRYTRVEANILLCPEYRNLSRGAQGVYEKLGVFINAETRSWQVSVALLAHYAGYSQPHVRRCLTELERAGLILRRPMFYPCSGGRRRRQGSNTYTLTVPESLKASLAPPPPKPSTLPSWLDDPPPLEPPTWWQEDGEPTTIEPSPSLSDEEPSTESFHDSIQMDPPPSQPCEGITTHCSYPSISLEHRLPSPTRPLDSLVSVGPPPRPDQAHAEEVHVDSLNQPLPKLRVLLEASEEQAASRPHPPKCAPDEASEVEELSQILAWATTTGPLGTPRLALRSADNTLDILRKARNRLGLAKAAGVIYGWATDPRLASDRQAIRDPAHRFRPTVGYLFEQKQGSKATKYADSFHALSAEDRAHLRPPRPATAEDARRLAAWLNPEEVRAFQSEVAFAEEFGDDALVQQRRDEAMAWLEDATAEIKAQMTQGQRFVVFPEVERDLEVFRWALTPETAEDRHARIDRMGADDAFAPTAETERGLDGPVAEVAEEPRARTRPVEPLAEELDRAVTALVAMPCPAGLTEDQVQSMRTIARVLDAELRRAAIRWRTRLRLVSALKAVQPRLKSGGFEVHAEAERLIKQAEEMLEEGRMRPGIDS